MTNYEASLRAHTGYESGEMRELRQYARSELNSGVDGLLRDCGTGRANFVPKMAKAFRHFAAVFF